jgi:hypothetical protein
MNPETYVVELTADEMNVIRLALFHWDGWDGTDTIDDETAETLRDITSRLTEIAA